VHARSPIGLLILLFRELLVVYARKLNVKTTLDKHNEKTFFNEAWDYLKGRFMQLCQLCGGLATPFPNTTSVESDFSIVKWEKNDSRNNLTSLSLAGISTQSNSSKSK
jgi:hypothetical protein